MRGTAPLFRFDAGWLYLIAGLAICMSGVLIPARATVRGLADQLEAIERVDERTVAELEAYGRFQDALDREDRGLIRRLAATQLNLMPEGDVPVLIDRSASARYADWIDASVSRATAVPAGPVDAGTRRVSMLERLATGSRRLWFLGAGVLCVFVGLVMSPELDARAVTRSMPKRRDDRRAMATTSESATGAETGIAMVPAAGLAATLKDVPVAEAAEPVSVDAPIEEPDDGDDVVDRVAPPVDRPVGEATVEIEFADDLFALLPSESAPAAREETRDIEECLPVGETDDVSVVDGLETAVDQGLACEYLGVAEVSEPACVDGVDVAVETRVSENKVAPHATTEKEREETEVTVEGAAETPVSVQEIEDNEESEAMDAVGSLEDPIDSVAEEAGATPREMPEVITVPQPETPAVATATTVVDVDEQVEADDVESEDEPGSAEDVLEDVDEDVEDVERVAEAVPEEVSEAAAEAVPEAVPEAATEEEPIAVDEEPEAAVADEGDEDDEDDGDEEYEYVYVDEDGNEISEADAEAEYDIADDGTEIDDADDGAEGEADADAEEDDEEYEYVYVDEDGNEIDAADVDDPDVEYEDDDEDEEGDDDEYEYVYEYVDEDEDGEDGDEEIDGDGEGERERAAG